jgi:hypothetical protein
VLGFGATVAGSVSHCFPLIFGTEANSVNGLNGILDVYEHALNQIQLAEPTYFTPVIRYVSTCASEPLRTRREYTILLILTDGIIKD